MTTAPLSPSKQWRCRYYSFSVNTISGEHEYCIKKGTFNFECSKQCPYVEIIDVMPKMTNYERIKNMTLEEMAEEICNTHKDCYECEFDKDCDFECDGVTKWLKSEASTETEEDTEK